MFIGYMYMPEGTIKKVRSLEEFRLSLAEDAERFWIDLEDSNEQELTQLGELLGLAEEAIEDCLQGEQRPRIDDYDDYFLIVLYGVVPPEGTPADGPRKLVVFCGPKFVLTVHDEPLRTTEWLRRRFKRHGQLYLAHGVDRLLFRLVDEIVDNYLIFIDQCDDEVEHLEMRSFDLVDEENLLREIAVLRRRLLEFRRLATAQRALLEPISKGDFDFVSRDLSEEFVHVRDHLTHALDRTEALRDRLNGALHNYHSALAKRTNDIMRVLTIFAAIMLPLSLIAGIYGMNVPIWPAEDSEGSFWGILAVMASIAGGLLWYFRRRGWL